jgi:hypothetical protein
MTDTHDFSPSEAIADELAQCKARLETMSEYASRTAGELAAERERCAGWARSIGGFMRLRQTEALAEQERGAAFLAANAADTILTGIESGRKAG